MSDSEHRSRRAVRVVRSESLEEQLEIFVANIIDVVPKSDLTLMEYPIFALAKKPSIESYRYENPNNGAWVEVVPSAEGQPTIFDKDLLIYCTSQIMEAINRGLTPSRRIWISAYDYFLATGRSTTGTDYSRLHQGLGRLRGLTIKTNVTSDGGLSAKGLVFGLIDDVELNIVKGRVEGLIVTMGKRLFDSLSNSRVLTYDREYFELTSPNERRLYELCRKHCGRQAIWEINIPHLYGKFGSRSDIREFRRMLKAIVSKQPLPRYCLDYHPKAGRNAPDKLVVMLDPKGDLKANYLAQQRSLAAE
jgi:plasmid replication initiation protein